MAEHLHFVNQQVRQSWEEFLTAKLIIYQHLIFELPTSNLTLFELVSSAHQYFAILPLELSTAVSQSSMSVEHWHLTFVLTSFDYLLFIKEFARYQCSIGPPSLSLNFLALDSLRNR